MAVRTFAQLKSEFESKDPRDWAADLVDTLSAQGSSSLRGLLETATNAEALATQSTDHAITPANLGNVLAKVFPVTFTGKNLAGACTATGLAVGDRVLGVSGVTTVGIVSSKFESVVTVANQIQQSAAENLSAQNYTALVYRPS
jgi:hypothetical protein